MFRRAVPISLCVVLLAGAAVRFYGISAKSLWLDEALSWRMQRYPPREIIERCADRVTTHPPLYFLLLHVWTRLVGDSEAEMRSLATRPPSDVYLVESDTFAALASLNRPEFPAEKWETVGHKIFTRDFNWESPIVVSQVRTRLTKAER